MNMEIDSEWSKFHEKIMEYINHSIDEKNTIYLAVLQVSLFRIDLSSIARVAFGLDSRGLESSRVKRFFSSPKSPYRFWNEP
jgi:hypothetical protein